MQDQFETLIDDAIRSYADAEPSPELATTILQRAQQEPSRRRPRLTLAFALALPAAAIVAITMVILSGPLVVPPAPPVVASAAAPPTIQSPPVPAKAATESVSAPAHVPKVEPARSTLRPLPNKYSRQELVLLSFVQSQPKEAAAIAEAQKQDMQPLAQRPVTISRLRIAPLTVSVLNPED